ncbi:DUF6612 family protein [Streptococcus sp. CSL10205-OR2]|uniref:DUF6612 family protein n=1 Tax=Streptococcus sp. CSL10205-OR2 TaxID=2980558 RepID=UPI0021D80911|nr:DUF6612 family protein [Streptococcus sp. CSL10205-OR2]MCU9533407.1 hypothetical protein [Streptococcus sp. CSL10205-OR2]
MKKYSRLGFIAIIGLLFLLAGCQSNTDSSDNNPTKETTKTTTKMTVEKFLNEVDVKNKALSSIEGKHDFEVRVDQNVSSQKIESTVVFDDSQLIKADILFDTKSQEGDSVKEKFIFDSNNKPEIYHESEAKGETTKEYTSTNGEEFYFHPDYFDVLENIKSLKDDLMIEDKGDVYELTLKNEEISLISTFGEQYNLSLTGITEDETEKSLTIHFDKETYFLKDFSLLITYEGNKGSLEMVVESEYSNWNKVDENDIKIPQK